MANNDELDMLRTISAPPPGRDAKSRALQSRPMDRGRVFVSSNEQQGSGVG
jgi:hypothetical protein